MAAARFKVLAKARATVGGGKTPPGVISDLVEGQSKMTEGVGGNHV